MFSLGKTQIASFFGALLVSAMIVTASIGPATHSIGHMMV